MSGNASRFQKIIRGVLKLRVAKWLIAALALAFLPAVSFACQSRTEPIQILSEDVEIHLGDQNDLVTPWKPLYHSVVPSTTWQGEFFVRSPGDGEWLLSMDVLQINDLGNMVRINGQKLRPGFLPERETDWASTWSRVSFVVPRGVLLPELNALSIQVGQWVPVFQTGTNFWEDIQFRNIVMRPRP